jgi:hypothetical protein
MIRPLHAQRLDIRCNVVDVVLSNVANHVVFFFERRLDTRALADAFVRALENLPVFAGRMALDKGCFANPMQGARRALHICVVRSHTP